MTMQKLGVIGIGESGAEILALIEGRMIARFGEMPEGIGLVGLIVDTEGQTRPRSDNVMWVNMSMTQDEVTDIRRHIQVGPTLADSLPDEAFAPDEPRRFNVMARLLLLHHHEQVRQTIGLMNDKLSESRI